MLDQWSGGLINKPQEEWFASSCSTSMKLLVTGTRTQQSKLLLSSDYSAASLNFGVVPATQPNAGVSSLMPTSTTAEPRWANALPSEHERDSPRPRSCTVGAAEPGVHAAASIRVRENSLLGATARWPSELFPAAATGLGFATRVHAEEPRWYGRYPARRTRADRSLVALSPFSSPTSKAQPNSSNGFAPSTPSCWRNTAKSCGPRLCNGTATRSIRKVTLSSSASRAPPTRSRAPWRPSARWPHTTGPTALRCAYVWPCIPASR